MTNRPKRKRWRPPARERLSAADAQQMLDALAASGQSAEAFAAEHGIAPQRISYWRRRLRAKAAGAPTGFLRAELTTQDVDAPAAEPTLEAKLASGRTVRVTGPWSRESIELWLSALEAHAC